MYKGGNGLSISFRETLLYLISYQLRMKKASLPTLITTLISRSRRDFSLGQCLTIL